MAQSSQNKRNSPAGADGRKRRLADCFARGKHLAKVDKNHDYAHAMFAECVLQEPGDLQFVDAMVQNLRASKPHVKKSLLRLRRGGSRALKKAVQHQEWGDVFPLGIELLKADPWDVVTLRAMAEACAALHQNEVELVYLKQALEAEPKNAEVSRHCARSLGRMGQFDQAIACWHRIETLKGKDAEAAKMIAILAEEKLRYPGGRPPTAQAKQAPTIEPEPEREPEEDPKEVVLSPRQRLEKVIAEEPLNTANYIALAELLLESDQFHAADAILRRAVDACGEQRTVVEQLERVRSLQAAEERRLAEERRAAEELANAPIRVPWLELVLGFAAIALIIQFVPAARAAVWNALDVTGWGPRGWFTFNVVALMVLVAVRFAPNLRAMMQRRPRRGKRMRSSNR